MLESTRIGFIGEAMAELSFHGDRTKMTFAGNALNSAVYFRRSSAANHQIEFISVVGCDPLSEKMTQFIEPRASQRIGNTPSC